MMLIAARVKEFGNSRAAVVLRKGFNIALSLLILLLLARAIGQVGWEQVVDAVPPSALFWLLFGASYLIQPLTEWFIYRRWWRFDWRAMPVFLRMRVMNDALFSYSGHTYLLVWAAARLGIEFDPDKPPARVLGRGDGPGTDPAKSPLAAVKDMAITSGLAGNLATLMMLLLALSMEGAAVLGQALDPRTLTILVWSFAGLIVLNVGILVFRRNIMSLPVSENLFAFWCHMVRVVGAQALLVASWAVALPGMPFETWFLLGSLRMVIMRLPVPNKEILFAAVAVSVTGDASVQIAALMAAQGALQLVFHVLSWAGAAAIETAAPEKAPVH